MGTMMTVKYWHRRIKGSEKWYLVERVRFQVRGKNVVLSGYTNANNCDVEVELDAATLMELMNAFVASKLEKVDPEGA